MLLVEEKNLNLVRDETKGLGWHSEFKKQTFGEVSGTDLSRLC